jgi:hypothetical protein
MAELTDLKRAYLIGIRDGFRLARAETVPETEDLITEIKADMNAKMRAVRTELAARGFPVDTERDPDAPLVKRPGLRGRFQLSQATAIMSRYRPSATPSVRWVTITSVA